MKPLTGRALVPLAWRNRILSLFGVGLYLSAMAWLLPGPEQRARHHYLIVVTIGYGHLIGALGRPISRSRNPEGICRHVPLRLEARSMRRAAWMLALLGLYLILLDLRPLIVIPLLIVASWHTVENDVCLRDTYTRDGRPGPLGHSLDDHLMAISASFLLMTVATSISGHTELPTSPESERLRDLALFSSRSLAVLSALGVIVRERSDRRSTVAVMLILAATLVPMEATSWRPLGVSLSFGDFFAATTLYHLISWLILSFDRARLGGCARPVVTHLAWAHVPSALLCGLSLAIQAPYVATMRDVVFSPSIYLFWSVAHVVQTIVRRARQGERV